MSDPTPDPNRYLIRLSDGGALYDPWDPTRVPSVRTVARASAMLCRYGGHVDRFLSVGEHSLWVMVAAVSSSGRTLSDPDVPHRDERNLASLLVRRSPALRAALRLVAPPGSRAARRGQMSLAHDAPEALGLLDVLGPVKRRPEMRPYAEADLRHLRSLCRGWGLPEFYDGGFLDFPDYASKYGAPADEAPSSVRLNWIAEMSRRGFREGPIGSPALTPEREDWDAVWAIDTSILGAEKALRPWSGTDGPGERQPPWPWLDLRTDVLSDGDPVSRAWVASATVTAWETFSGAPLPPEDGR